MTTEVAEVVEEVVEEPTTEVVEKPKKGRGRPKGGSKNPSKKARTDNQ